MGFKYWLNTNPSFDVWHFFLKISETLKAHISGTKAVLTNDKKLSSWLSVFFILASEKLPNISMHKVRSLGYVVIFYSI